MDLDLDLLLLYLCQLLPPLSCCHCKYFYLRNVTKLEILQRNFTPQIIVALPHPFFFFLEQLGLENWTENSWQAMILFPLHYHHQSNWMISCLYLLFWKLTKIKSKRWKSRKCHYLFLNCSVLILIISFQINQRRTAGESSTFSRALGLRPFWLNDNFQKLITEKRSSSHCH